VKRYPSNFNVTDTRQEKSMSSINMLFYLGIIRNQTCQILCPSKIKTAKFNYLKLHNFKPVNTRPPKGGGGKPAGYRRAGLFPIPPLGPRHLTEVAR